MPHGTGKAAELGAASRIKWVLFCLMVTTVPVLYFTWRLVAFAGISATLVALSFLPVYGVGHHQSHSVNLYRLLNRLFTDGL